MASIKMQKSLQKLVEQDILTGLYNRRSGEKLLKRVCENYEKDGTPFCIAIGDVDHFKNVNDTGMNAEMWRLQSFLQG